MLGDLRDLLGSIFRRRATGTFIRRSQARIKNCGCARPAAAKNWRVSSSCVAGTRHLDMGRGCEDAAGAFVVGRLLGVAIADGAGSAPRGGMGAALAVRAAIAAIEHAYLNDEPVTQETAPGIMRTAFCCAQKTLCVEARRQSTSPREFGCTLIVVIAGDNHVAAGQVGDGAVVVQTDSSDLITLSTPANGEFANETPLLGCGESVALNISSVSNIPIRALALFTDGMQRLALEMPAGKPHAGFFTPLFDGLGTLAEGDAERELAAFLNSPRVSARTDDDKTLVVAHLL